MIHAVIAKDILWPQKQEDRAEGGWETAPEEQPACDTSRCPAHIPAPVLMENGNRGSEDVRDVNSYARDNDQSDLDDESATKMFTDGAAGKSAEPRTAEDAA